MCGSAASIASMFAYQSLRGLIRSFAGASGASRSMSKVNFTSFEVNGWPSCHLTFLRRKNTRFRKLSCHDHFSASSPMIVSTLSVFFRGSKSTRLLKQGIAGQTVEIVDVSWIAKPCERSSRSIMLRTPPDFGVGAEAVWLAAGPIRTTPTRNAIRSAENGAMRARDMETSREIWRVEVYVKTPHPTNRFHPPPTGPARFHALAQRRMSLAGIRRDATTALIEHATAPALAGLLGLGSVATRVVSVAVARRGMIRHEGMTAVVVATGPRPSSPARAGEA